MLRRVEALLTDCDDSDMGTTKELRALLDDSFAHYYFSREK
jgi:hypothetical protein